jgi:hypothetical protein
MIGFPARISPRAAITCFIGMNLFTNGAANAAPEIPEGWNLSASAGEATNSEVYVYGQDNGVLSVIKTPMTAISNPRSIAQALDLDNCKGLGNAAMRDKHGGPWFQTVGPSGIHCNLFITQGDGQAYAILTLEQNPTQSNALDFATAIIRDKKGLRVDGGVARASGAAPKEPVSSAQAGNNNAALQKAIAAVPAANRPVAMVTRQEAQNSGGYVYYVYQPWMLFANGWATDSRCYDWDPRFLAPTPASLGTAGKRCELVKWRKTGTEYYFQDEDGSWDDAGKGAKLYAFTAGQQVEADLENTSGAGTAPVTGMISVNTIWSGKLKMSKTGFIQTDWANQTGISGGGFGGGASGGGTSSGRYYVNGYLIAVGDDRGGVSVGFIAGSHDENQPRYTYIYLNGDLYWPPEKK